MRLSYSKYNTYLACPRKYKNQEDKVEPPEPDNKYFALYGILIQRFFQDYVNILLPKSMLVTDEFIKNYLRKQWEKVLAENYINWTDPFVSQNAEQIFEEVYTNVLENIKTYSSLFRECHSEVGLYIKLKKSGDEINGRLDFIRDCKDGTVEILDGKSTSHLDRVDVDQLYFYALLYSLKHGKLPDKVGFLFFRYCTIQYIDFNADILLKFKNKLALTKETIKKDKEFKPTVKLSKTCMWCSYKLICDEYCSKKAANRTKRSLTKDNPCDMLIEM